VNEHGTYSYELDRDLEEGHNNNEGEQFTLEDHIALLEREKPII
jgi:hypothetical protein